MHCKYKKKSSRIISIIKVGRSISFINNDVSETSKKVLANVKERLDNKDRCILIATSLVEAGVDLDF